MKLASCFALAAAVLAGALTLPAEARAEVKFQLGYGASYGYGQRHGDLPYAKRSRFKDAPYGYRSKKYRSKKYRHGYYPKKRRAYRYPAKRHSYISKHRHSRHWVMPTYGGWPPRAYPRHAGPAPSFAGRGGAYPCREFTRTLHFRDGGRRNIAGTACRQPDGRWLEVR